MRKLRHVPYPASLPVMFFLHLLFVSWDVNVDTKSNLCPFVRVCFCLWHFALRSEKQTGAWTPFIVALSQTYDGKEDKPWYASTLDIYLQLTSLEFCIACRNVPVSRVCVEKGTPRSLWSPTTSHSTECSTVGLGTRVPAVRPLRLRWAVPMDGQEMSVQAVSSWPASLQQLSFWEHFDQPIAGVVWPVSLQRLSFGSRSRFNQPIARVVWPSSLKQMPFGTRFNHPIAGVGWPASLEQLSFGYRFNQPILEVLWPASLQQVSFEGRFDQPIAEVLWPSSLKKL